MSLCPYMSFRRRCKAMARNPGQPPEYTTLDPYSSVAPRNDMEKENGIIAASLRAQHLGMT